MRPSGTGILPPIRIVSMSERDAIGRSGPHTVKTMGRDLRAAGVVEGMTLLVHSSLSSVGFM